MHPLLPERNDVLPDGRAPKHIRKFLRDVGGITPWEENRYRLVLAECVMVYGGARWHDWDKAAELTDQGGLRFSGQRKSTYLMRDPTNHSREIAIEADVPAFVGVKPNHPIRVIEEMRWIPRYTDIKGWLFQVWYPPTYYSREHYEVTVKGRPDLPLLGEFPAHGQYERQFVYMCEGELHETFPNMPGESWMERAIEHHEKKLAEDRSPNVEWRMLVTLRDMQRARLAYEQKQRAEFEAKVKDRISPIFSSSLEGGRFREELARRCLEKGIKLGHVGN
jgi:hypothetical protein